MTKSLSFLGCELCAPGGNGHPLALLHYHPSLDESLTKLIDHHTMCGATEGADGLENYVRRDTLQVVKCAIAVVRRRRSVKAIEMLDQVQFLTEYMDFLQDGQTIHTRVTTSGWRDMLKEAARSYTT
ncbi:uncharacterized protein EDB93DRAFT_1100972 [Suillus bovinus]|uniref:uncharacterized protein n=1 Tax=Suillus bovinus TaxID=48563 RepID=UPI001B87FE6A|nr:uncharacterized protein EDB93DRAFT_1100972 [Suillus bovinus]KAG2157622.1 hypothetical protein EDB93DRAFT_1100972 [Suillus bovinus]